MLAWKEQQQPPPQNKSKKKTNKRKTKNIIFKTTTNSWHKTSKNSETPSKKQHLRKINIGEEESWLKDPEYIFHKKSKKNFLNLKKMSIKVQQVYRTQNQFYQKRKSPRHIIKHLTYRTKKECWALQGKKTK